MAEQPNELNVFSPEFKENAYEIYRQLREADPVHKLQLPGGEEGWLITRYQDVQEVFKDAKFKKDFSNVTDNDPEYFLESGAYIGENMLMKDPPDHTRLRKLVSKAFTPKMINQMQEDITQITDQLLDDINPDEPVDLIKQFALPLPITVISNMLGIPEDDRDVFHEWSAMIVAAANDQSKIAEQQNAINDFVAYIKELIEKKRQNPDGRLISLLIEAHDEGDRLTEAELVATVFLLIVAGHETTVNLIGNGVVALLDHPKQREALAEDFDNKIQSALEELLRYHSPVEIAPVRYAAETWEWEWQTLHKGDPVFLSLASANRDPAVFDNPDNLDLGRASNPHLAFGKGMHFCLGAPLARQEAEIAFRRLFERFPDFQYAVPREEVKWGEGMMMRSLETLPIRLK